MLAAAETDFEPHLGWRQREQGRERLGGLLAQNEREAWQQGFEQGGLMRAQAVAFAPPEKAPLMRIRDLVQLRCDGQAAWELGAWFQETAPRIAPTRSIFSQEKPPSFSGLRPKWP